MAARSGRILVVEENLDLLEALQEMLEAMGFEVSVFASEIQAINAVAASGAAFDLLIGDAAPAVGDGVGLVERFRVRCGPMPALLLAGGGMSDLLRRRVAAGEVATLSVPFSARQLQSAVDREMRARDTVAEAVRGRSLREDAEAVEASGREGWSPITWALPLAAGLALVVGLAVQQLGSGPPSLPPNPAEQVMRGAGLEALEPRGVVDLAPARFAWIGHPDAAAYLLSVHRVDESLAWSHMSEQAFDEPPPEILATFSPSVTYRWAVEAVDSSGKPIARSARTEFEIRPRIEEVPRQEEQPR